jgi:hypothetical protein
MDASLVVIEKGVQFTVKTAKIMTRTKTVHDIEDVQKKLNNLVGRFLIASFGPI